MFSFYCNNINQYDPNNPIINEIVSIILNAPSPSYFNKRLNDPSLQQLASTVSNEGPASLRMHSQDVGSLFLLFLSNFTEALFFPSEYEGSFCSVCRAKNRLSLFRIFFAMLPDNNKKLLSNVFSIVNACFPNKMDAAYLFRPYITRAMPYENEFALNIIKEIFEHSDYISLIVDDNNITSIPTEKRLRAVVCYDFVSDKPEVFSLKIGEYLDIEKAYPGDWLSGILNGKNGFLPAGFIKLVPENNYQPPAPTNSSFAPNFPPSTNSPNRSYGSNNFPPPPPSNQQNNNFVPSNNQTNFIPPPLNNQPNNNSFLPPSNNRPNRSYGSNNFPPPPINNQNSTFNNCLPPPSNNNLNRNYGSNCSPVHAGQNYCTNPNNFSVFPPGPNRSFGASNFPAPPVNNGFNSYLPNNGSNIVGPNRSAGPFNSFPPVPRDPSLSATTGSFPPANNFKPQISNLPQQPSTAPSSPSSVSSSSSVHTTDCKVAVVGSGGVGKSAITISFVQNHFIEEYDPTIEDSYRKQITVDGQPCLINILDTAGQEEYGAMRDQYMRNGQGFLLVFSLTARSTFEEVPSLRTTILQVKESDSVPILLAANKWDMQNDHQVTKEEVDNLSKTLGVRYRFTSAKDHYNVDECFEDLVRAIRRTHVGVTKKRRKPCSIL